MDADILNIICKYTNDLEKLLLTSKEFNLILNENEIIINLKKFFGSSYKSTIIRDIDNFVTRALLVHNNIALKWLLSNKTIKNKVYIPDYLSDIYTKCDFKTFKYFLNKNENYIFTFLRKIPFYLSLEK